MPYMLIWCFAENDHIINVTPSKGHTRENLVHHSLKLNNCILEAKWKTFSMIQLILPILINSPECGFHSISHKQWELVIAGSQVQGAKDPRKSDGIEQLL